MYPLIFYMLKCLIFRYLLKIDNISAKKDISKVWKSEKSPYLCFRKRERNRNQKSSLIILKAKKRTAIDTAFWVYLSFVLMLHKNG